MIVTRFAPSPNGPLHLGHAYSAIVAHDLARAAGGRFLLRIEDIDLGRSRPELADACRRDLAWLGLAWDEVPAQSTRFATYKQVLAEALLGEGRVYPCRCTRAQIAAVATRKGPDGPIYPGTCKEANVDPDTPGISWRLDLARCLELRPDYEALGWDDALAGEQLAQPRLFGDIVLMRKDGSPSYHFAATLDDAIDGVTLVTRGLDLFPATHIHRVLQAQLGLPVPRYHHHALLVDENGQKLAKRRGSPSLSDRREAGEDGLALAQSCVWTKYPLA